MIFLSFLALLCILASGVCFFLSLGLQNTALTICGGLFVLYLSVLFHELGHVFACILKNRKMAAFYLYPLKIEKGKLSLSKKFKFSLVFYKGKKDVLIHLFGPIFTFLQLIVALIGIFSTPNAHTIVFLLISIALLFGCEQDLYRVFHKEKPTNKD